jgi:hypothetical protein
MLIDWDKWANAPAWTHLEAACLTFGLEPAVPNSADAKIICSREPAGQKSDLGRVQRHYRLTRLAFPKDKPIDPVEFVRWVVADGHCSLPAEMVQILGDGLHLPRYSIKQVAHAVAAQEEWNADARDALRDQMLRDAGHALGILHANYWLDDDPGSVQLLEPADASAWLLKYRGIVWPVSDTSPTVAELTKSEPGAVVTADVFDAAAPFDGPVNGPSPLPKRAMAQVFDGIGGKSEEEWMRTLGDLKHAAWLRPALAKEGARGKSATWFPVKFAELLRGKRNADYAVLNKCFLTAPHLRPWLSAWQEFLNESDWRQRR